MQRNFSDIVVDIDFLAHGLSHEAPSDPASSRRQRTDAARRQQEILTSLAQIGMPPVHAGEQDCGNHETRAEWLCRQQDLIDSLAGEIMRNALESCRALHLADANANVSALCAYRDADLRQLAAEVTRRRERLQNRLARDRALLGFGAGQCARASESGHRGEAMGAKDEISKNSLDHGDAEMF